MRRNNLVCTMIQILVVGSVSSLMMSVLFLHAYSVFMLVMSCEGRLETAEQPYLAIDYRRRKSYNKQKPKISIFFSIPSLSAHAHCANSQSEIRRVAIRDVPILTGSSISSITVAVTIAV